MGTVYQLTFFLALGLLAIVITIFVFAVSLLGRATESASVEQQDILLKQKRAKAKQIEKIQGQLEKAREVGQLDESKLLEELKNTKEEIAGYETELRRLQETIMLIKRKGAVVWPGAFFLMALVLTTIASGLAGGQSSFALPSWIISIGALVFGIYRVFRTLGAIEEVTITYKETKEKLPEAVKTALRELEEERKPELELIFRDEQPPFHIEADTKMELIFGLGIMRGEVARKPIVGFFAPSCFDFPDRKMWLQPEGVKKIGGLITTSFHFNDCLKGVISEKHITIKAPHEKGTYSILYRVHCEGFASGYKEFEVVVE